MYRFFDSVIKPIMDARKPRDIVEIGSAYGLNTRNLLEYCEADGGTLHAIDPLPMFDAVEWQEKHGGHFVFHAMRSLEALPLIDRMDLVLIDGDHNWYTVYNELKLIGSRAKEEQRELPIILLHDVSWPYARRDLYYDPETVPAEYRHPYERLGMVPGSADLVQQGGLNSFLLNAVVEGGPRNGILTAIEDFLDESDQEFQFITLPSLSGCAILIPKSLREKHRDLMQFTDLLIMPDTLKEVLQDAEMKAELERVNLITTIVESEKTAEEQDAQLQSLTKNLGNTQEKILEAEARFQRYVEDVSEHQKVVDRHVESQNTSLTKKEEQLAQKDGQLAQKDGQLAQKDGQLAQKDEQLAQKDEQLAQKEEQLVQKDGQLAEQLAQKDRQLAQKDEQLARKDHDYVRFIEDSAKHSSTYERRIEDAEDLLAQREAQVVQKSEEMARMMREAAVHQKNVDAHVKYLDSSVRQLMAWQEEMHGCAEQMLRGWWRMGSRKRAAKRARELIEEARAYAASTHGAHERSAPSPLAGGGGESFEGLYFTDTSSLLRYMSDRQLLLSWLNALFDDMSQMHKLPWWQLGLKARVLLAKLRVRPYPVMPYDWAEKLMESSGEWGRDSRDLCERMRTASAPGSVAVSDIEELMKRIENLGQLIHDMESVWWWQFGLRVRRILGWLHLRRRDFRPSTQHAKTVMDSFIEWQESVTDWNELYGLTVHPASSPAQLFPVDEGVAPTLLKTASTGFTATDVLLRTIPDKVDIIVPVYNSYDYVRRCVLSILKHTTFPYRLIIMDDCSTEEALHEFYQGLSSLDFVTVHRNADNVGFVANINRGFRLSTRDVVLLNSDVCVTPRWLRKLVVSAYSNVRAASVASLSNAATIFSVPSFCEDSPIPDSETITSMARLVEDVAGRRYAEVPTGVGCCMYIKRHALDEVGLFDEEAFGRGYGEENDFCARALARGWTHILDDSTFIFHEGSVSFGPEREELIEQHQKVLEDLHPQYLPMVSKFVSSGVMQQVVGKVGAAVNQNASTPAGPAHFLAHQETKRILFVIHQGGGGTQGMAWDLLASLPLHYENYCLVCDGRTVTLSKFHQPDTFEELESHELSKLIAISDFTQDQYRLLVTDILLKYHFDLIHIHHLIGHTFDLPRVAQKLGIAYLITFHDLYFVCPTVNLLNYDQKFCNGECKPSGDRQCYLPTPNLAQAPLLPGRWALTWRRQARSILRDAVGFIAPTESTKQFILGQYPELAEKPFLAIEHGRDIVNRRLGAEVPVGEGKVRFVTMGDIVLHKGSQLIRSLANHDGGERFEFHVLGRVSEDLEDVPGIVCHGKYEREDLVDILQGIQPSFALLLSIWPETFCYTLTEAWAQGIPVIVSDLGALKERVEKSGGGWIVNHADPEQLYDQVSAIASDREGYRQKIDEIDRMEFKSLSQMAQEYHLYYQSLLRPCAHELERSARTRPVFAIIPGSRKPPYNGTDCYRLLRPFEALKNSEKIDIVVCDINRVADSYPDVVVTQRTALTDEEARSLVDFCKEERIKLIYDIDDNLLSMEDHPEEEAYELSRQAVEFLLTNADLVTVSTEELRTTFASYNPNIRTIPNLIDTSLWASGSREFALPPSPKSGELITFGFMGTVTHVNDLGIVKEAITQILDKHSNVRFEMVGGRTDDTDQDWYSRIVVPGDNGQFLNFVGWFRDNCQWDFALAPLETSHFNQYKSNIKALEYAAKGTSAIYSKGTVFDDLIEDGQNGLLVENTTEAWFDAIERMIMNPDLRERIRQEAFTRLEREHLLHDNLHYWLESLEQAGIIPLQA